MLGVAGLFGVPGLLALGRSWRKTTKWTVSHGIITGARSSGPPGGEANVYFPNVEICCPDGRRYNFQGSTGSGRYPPIGEKVKVVYDPEDPTDGDLLWNLWFGPGVLLLLGGFCLVFSLLSYAGLTFE